MRRMPLWMVAVAALACGCGVNQAMLTGHDFVDEAASALARGIEEYHADDGQRLEVARAHAAEAFAKDVAAVAQDPAKVQAKTREFLDLLAAAEQAGGAEKQRYDRLRGWLEKLAEVNADMREISEWRLRWNDQVRGYVRTLREKANAVRSRAIVD